jgi:uncharacterized membrane protein
VSKNRLEAFSDGVLAIIITIMVLELKAPVGSTWSDLARLVPVFLSYVLSFLYVGIYWNNHHHLLQAAKGVTASILWANLHLLFWLSLFPFATAWMGNSGAATVPTALYGVVLLLAASGYFILQQCVLAGHGRDSALGREFSRDWKGKLSPVAYLLAIPLAYVEPWMSNALYLGVALVWLVPDRRIERALR